MITNLFWGTGSNSPKWGVFILLARGEGAALKMPEGAGIGWLRRRGQVPRVQSRCPRRPPWHHNGLL